MPDQNLHPRQRVPTAAADSAASPREVEDLCRTLFRQSPMSVWEVDLSGVKARCEAWRRAGAVEVRAHLEQHPALVRECAGSIRVVDFNAASVELLGVSTPAEVLPRLRTLLDDSALGAWREALGALAEGHRHCRGRLTLRLPLGEVRRVEAHLALTEGAATTWERAVIWLEDVTGQCRAEERLRAESRLLDLVPDAIMVRDLDDAIQYWSRGAELLYGWKAEQVTGRTLNALLNGDPARALEAHQQALQRGEWRGELTHRAQDERTVFVDSRWTLLRDDAGAPSAFLVINRDQSEQRQIETQLLRTQRLESVGLLASGIAHDLNNILAPILMAAPLLRAAEPRPEDERLLEIIESNAQRGANIVRQLLTFGRGIPGERTAVQVRHLARDMAKIARETFPRQITVKEDLPRDLWLVLGDATQLHQVLLNLCVNARDAMPAGGTLTLRLSNQRLDEVQAGLHVQGRPGAYVLLEVRDTGTGIPPEIRDRIFDPFFTTKALGQGTGLGLSTVLGIVRSHKGFIDVRSTVGRGTSFGIYLPATPDASPEVQAQAAAAAHAGRGELILVVDDEAHLCKVVRVALEKHGYAVETARDGAEAISVYTQHRGEVRAVVTDIMMPIMDGVALVRVLRRTDPLLPVIASSGLGSGLTEANQAELKTLGVSVFLAKPYSAEVLLRNLEELLRKTPAPAASPPGPAPSAVAPTERA